MYVKYPLVEKCPQVDGSGREMMTHVLFMSPDYGTKLPEIVQDLF